MSRRCGKLKPCPLPPLHDTRKKITFDKVCEFNLTRSPAQISDAIPT